jgi:hypothetical protein
MRNTRFKVVITVYQRPELLLRALLSLLHQTYSAWDCVILSDGPAPHAMALTQRFARVISDERIQGASFVALERREGLWGNHLRRWALERCTQDYCVILSHDCELFPHYLEEHHQQIAGQPGKLSIVGTHIWNARVLGAPNTLLPHPEYLGVWPKGTDPKRLKIADVDLTGLAFPAAESVQAGCFAEEDQLRYAADYLAYARLVKTGVPVVMSRRPCAAHF